MADLQRRRVRSIVRHAWERVPFYRETWCRHGVQVDEIRGPEDLPRLPVITKHELRAANERAMASGVRRSRCLPVWTSGTEGEPFTIQITRAEAQNRRLVNFRVLLAMALKPGDRLVVVGPTTHRSPTLIERAGVYRTRVVPGDLPLEQQIDRVARFRPTVLWSYPGPLHSILHQLGYQLSSLITPRMIITSGGTLLPTVARFLSEDLGCELFNSYGCMEVGRLAAECPEHRGLHVQDDQVILERGGGEGNIVTGLNQYAMPLIRYRLGDVCSFSSGDCPCGSPFPRLERVVGRADDMLRLPSGRLISPWKPQSVLAAMGNITQFRFVQDRPDRIVLHLVVEDGWTAENTERVRRRLGEVLGEPIGIEIELTDTMPVDERAHRSVISPFAGRM